MAAVRGAAGPGLLYGAVLNARRIVQGGRAAAAAEQLAGWLAGWSGEGERARLVCGVAAEDRRLARDALALARAAGQGPDSVAVTALLPAAAEGSVESRVVVALQELGVEAVDGVAFDWPFVSSAPSRQAVFDPGRYAEDVRELQRLQRAGSHQRTGGGHLTARKLLRLSEVGDAPALDFVLAEAHPLLPQEELWRACLEAQAEVISLLPFGPPAGADGLVAEEKVTMRRILRDQPEDGPRFTAYHVLLEWALARGSCVVDPLSAAEAGAAQARRAGPCFEYQPRHERMLQSLGDQHTRWLTGGAEWDPDTGLLAPVDGGAKPDSTSGAANLNALLWDEVPLNARGLPLPGAELLRFSADGRDHRPGSAFSHGVSFWGRSDRSHAFVVQDEDGALKCYLNRCPHVGVGLDFVPGKFLSRDGAEIVCSTHGARFRRADGMCTIGPCVGKSLVPIRVRGRGASVLAA